MSYSLRIGLSFFFSNQTNSGIVNYVYNIIAALKTLKEDERPAIVVFYGNDAPIEYLKSIQYPRISFVLFREYPSNNWVWRTNNLLLKLTGKNFYYYARYHSKIDCLYPFFDFLDFGLSAAPGKIRWLVDFNNRAFPDHYIDKGDSTTRFQDNIAQDKGLKVVLSSYALLEELKMYHPDYECDVKILRFASTLPDIVQVNLKELLSRYNITETYLMSPNQFWEHKNQVVILDALKLIKNAHPELKFKILFTGSLEVHRGKGYYAEKLKNKIEEYGLQQYVLFLGVLERTEQLALMNGATALIQPSLYEGWSTLVEEAKALNKFIILSNLPVHKEQINTNVDFFDPHNAEELSIKILNQIQNPATIQPLNYNINIREFGKNIVDAFK